MSVKVFIEDAREIGYCVSGQKEFFKRHKLDFKGYLENGLDSEVFRKTGDAMAIKLAEHAEQKRGK